MNKTAESWENPLHRLVCLVSFMLEYTFYERRLYLTRLR
jgi:hypothetical protein